MFARMFKRIVSTKENIFMPKIKTNRSVAKRFKITGKGKVTRHKGFKSHLLSHKPRKRKRMLRRPAIIENKIMHRKIKSMLPYA